MRCLLSIATPLLLSSFLVGQTFVYSPDASLGFTEGGGRATSFGAFAEGRHQIADGNQSAMSIVAMGFRHNHQSYGADGEGRSWTNVVVQMAEGSAASLTTTYSMNALTTPTSVFSGAINWPTMSGAPASCPATWTLNVPFSSPWTYTAANDILADFTFTGGALANSGSWSGSTALPYSLDSFTVGTSVVGPDADIGNVVGGCVDTGNAGPNGAAMKLLTTTYGPTHPSPSLQNRYTIEASGTDFAPNTSTMMILAFAADTAGVQFPGTTCNNIHLTLARLWFYYPMTADAVGNLAPFDFGLPGGVAYDPNWRGINVVVQSVWNDTVNTQLKFSSLSRNSFVGVPATAPGGVNMGAAYGASAAAATATSLSTGNPADVPAIRYEN